MKDEPAFPVVNHHDFHESYSGMTLRDYFAGQAIAGLVSNRDALINYVIEGGPERVARNAYALADAMLEARKQ